MGTIVGVDEAGRGPVLGSLFVGAVAVVDRGVLPDGVDDSKAVPATTRARLADALERDRAIDVAIEELEPRQIDRAAGSLTAQVAAAFARAIDRLATAGDAVVADAGEADTHRFADRVRRHLSTPVDLEVTVRADETDPLVGAASIVAKEAREAHVDGLTERYGAVGSGYPSDPTTRRFLAEYVAEHGGLPACARRSWATSRDVIAASEQAGLGAFIRTGRRG